MNMKNLITIGLPSKGRLKEDSINFFEKNNFKPTSNGGERNYFAQIENLPNSKIIREFLKINCSIDKLEKTLKNFVKKNKLSNNIFKDLSTIKNLRKINSKTIFSTNFGRDIEYYTGIVFEIYNSSKKEIARGGRYDGLLKSLGSKKNISAVGAAINLNNL